MADHERIWLQAAVDADYLSEGRMWCKDKVWPADPMDSEPTEYVRADLFAALQSENARMKEALEPFAEYGRVLDSVYPTPHGGEFQIAPRICGPDDLRHIVTITLADLRRAALPAPIVTQPQKGDAG